MPEKIGFVGVGRMGSNMARRLKECGYEIAAVYDANTGAAQTLAQEFFNDEQRIILTGQPLINKLERIIDRDGRVSWASVTKVPLYNKSGTVTGIIGISRDVTKLKEAEATLRLAAAQRGAEPKVRQNLALVVGLQGRFQEAETIAKGDLSPDEAAANVAYLRQMLAQQSDWKKGKRGSPLVPTTGS